MSVPGTPGEPPEPLPADLAVHAATRPLNVAALVVVVAVALLLGAPLIVAALAGMVAYTAAAARTLFRVAAASGDDA
jgi:hypothetical protein